MAAPSASKMDVNFKCPKIPQLWSGKWPKKFQEVNELSDYIHADFPDDILINKVDNRARSERWKMVAPNAFKMNGNFKWLKTWKTIKKKKFQDVTELSDYIQADFHGDISINKVDNRARSERWKDGGSERFRNECRNFKRVKTPKNTTVKMPKNSKMSLSYATMSTPISSWKCPQFRKLIEGKEEAAKRRGQTATARLHSA